MHGWLNCTAIARPTSGANFIQGMYYSFKCWGMTFLNMQMWLKNFTGKTSGKGKSLVFASNHDYVAPMHGTQYEICVKKSTSLFIKDMAAPLHACNVYFFSNSSSSIEVIYFSFPAQTHLLAELIRQSFSEHIVCCQDLRINIVLHVWIELLSQKICYTKLVTRSSGSGTLPDGNK